MISREDSPESIPEAETSQAETANSFTNSAETSEWDASGLDASAESSADSSEQDVSVSVVYVPAVASDIVIEAVDVYEPEYLNYNLYFGIVFGFYIVLRLMKFVRKALFVRFDGSVKEA